MIYDNLEDTNEASRSIPGISSQIAVAGRSHRIARVHSHRPTTPAAVHWQRKPKMLVVMDAYGGKIIGQPFPIGDRVDADVYDPETGPIAAATCEATLHTIHEDSPDEYSVVETVNTEFGAKTMGLDLENPQPLPHHIGFWSGTGPTTAQQPHPQPVAAPATFSPSDLWAL
jgi:hypothetical protein